MTFETAVAFVLEQEGGVSNLAGDSGGFTKFGISQNKHPDLDIAGLTRQQAIEIYRADYRNKLHCNQLPNGLDLLVFDAVVNEGPTCAAKMLQAALRVTEDGIVGPSTIDAARHATHAVTDYLAQRMYQYAINPQISIFGRGWYRRLARAAQLAFDPDIAIECAP
jgi:lysozyme family protein